jgi:metallo-beta-lactamase family protein
MINLTFLGAAKTVTGSRFLLEVDKKLFLIDCGLFQGLKELRLKNWDVFPINPATIDVIVLTHAHIDHTGYLPRIYRQGYSNPIYATKSTTDLCNIMLPDSAYLQEEDARYANKKKFSKHSPALPLYTVEDAEGVLELFKPVPYGEKIELSSKMTLTFRDAGHILGSSFADFRVKFNGTERRILFSGDLGRPGQPILRDPHAVFGVDYLVLESTYGGRLHEKNNVKVEIARIVNESIERGGILIIPSFAVGRTQALLYTFRELEEEKQIPQVPVFVDSPLAIDATEIFMSNAKDHDLESKVIAMGGRNILKTSNLKFTPTTEQSKALNKIKSNAIIISASGMATGGRILHHLYNRLPDPRNTVLFIGYQAEGTRGRTILNGAEKVKIHGQYVPIRSKVESTSGFSAHADHNEILAWLSNFNKPPKRVFIVHGEPEQSEALSEGIQSKLGWEVQIPEYEESFLLE